jgi:HTH-type transcriptional regulator/antitoxin HigA
MNIKPIRTEDDYKTACERIDEIFHAEPGSKEDDELDVLVTLVDAYEEKHFPLGMPNPIEAIKIQMENLGLSRKELMEGLNKSSGRISDILNCRRALTLADIRVLSKLLHIPVETLSQDYPLEKVRSKDTFNDLRSASNG